MANRLKAPVQPYLKGIEVSCSWRPSCHPTGGSFCLPRLHPVFWAVFAGFTLHEEAQRVHHGARRASHRDKGMHPLTGRDGLARLVRCSKGVIA